MWMLKLIVLVFALISKTVFARPQLDLPPLVGPPPLQIFVPDLQLIRAQPEPQPEPQTAPEPTTLPPPPPPPLPPPQPVQARTFDVASIIRNDYNLRFNNEGEITGYSYAVETGDGLQKEEDGVIRQLGPGDAGPAVTGRYSYIGQDGNRRTVSYSADENGYRPKFLE